MAVVKCPWCNSTNIRYLEPGAGLGDPRQCLGCGKCFYVEEDDWQVEPILYPGKPAPDDPLGLGEEARYVSV